MGKACFKCGSVKPLDAFYRHAMMADGRLNKCKDCTKIDARRHRQANIHRIRDYDRERGRLPHRVEERKRRGVEFVAKEPLKYVAHTAVSNAVRGGKLPKSPCAFCGATEALEAHHHDYAKPLDITWLCKPCHRRFHALERMAAEASKAA